MPVYTTPNYTRVVLRTLHASPSTVVLRDTEPVYHSHQRWPSAADVRSGTVFGPGQFEQQTYETGTLVSGGGSAVFRPIGSPVVRRVVP